MKFYEIKDYPRGSFESSYRRKAYLTLPDNLKSIAIYKSGGGMGDLVQSIPLFRSFREMFPKAKIVYLGLYQRPRCNTIFSNIPYIDEYVEYVRPGSEKTFRDYFRFLKRFYRSFDLIVDTQSKFAASFYLWLLKPRYFLSRNPFFSHWRFILNPKLKVHVVAKMLSLARIIGFEKINPKPTIQISEEYLSSTQNYLKKFSGPFIAVLPGAGDPFKMWGKDKFAALADAFYSMGYQVILVGAEEERGLLLEIARIMKNKPIIPLVEDPRFGRDPIYSVGLFQSSRLTVGCDCGGLHLATLTGCPVVGIYGPTNPLKSGPLGEKNIVIYRGMDCSPCRMRQCKIGQRCLDDISPGEIIKAASFILRNCS